MFSFPLTEIKALTKNFLLKVSSILACFCEYFFSHASINTDGIKFHMKLPIRFPPLLAYTSFPEQLCQTDIKTFSKSVVTMPTFLNVVIL